MKNFIIGTIIFALTMSMFCTVGYIECHYTKSGTITNIQNDIITVEDSKGQQWEFIGKGYELDQEVTMVMYTNHTDSRYDDSIERVR